MNKPTSQFVCQPYLNMKINLFFPDMTPQTFISNNKFNANNDNYKDIIHIIK